MSINDNDKTNDLIDRLAGTLRPRACLGHPYVCSVPYFIVSFLYVAVIVYFAGMRPDFSEKLNDVNFIVEIILAGFMAITAGLASTWIAIPDMRGQKRMLVFPFLALFALIGWSLFRALGEGVLLQYPHWDMCFNEGILMGLVPAAIVMMLTIRGATTRPYLSAIINTLSVTGVAYIGLRLTCMMDTVGHSLIYHVFPFIIFGTVLGIFARKIYKW